MLPISAPLRTLRPGPLSRALLLVDRGETVRRVIPVPIMIALDEPQLLTDAHLCHGGDFDRVFTARAAAYAAFLLSPEKRRFLFDNFMTLEDMTDLVRSKPASSSELARAELFDAVQGGNRASLLGVHPTEWVYWFMGHPHMDHA